MIRANRVSKRYGKNWVLKDLSFKLIPGTITGLLGRNGSGKSTLFRLLAGLSRPDTGTIDLEGQPIGAVARRRISFQPEVHPFYRAMSVSRQLRFIAGFYPSWDQVKSNTLLNQLELEGDSLINELSEGHKARLKLVAAFSWKSDVVLLDEPLKGIDQPSRRMILQLLLDEFRSDEQAILISTHHAEELEASLDDVLVLNHGRIVCHRGVDELREAYNCPLSEAIEMVEERD